MLFSFFINRKLSFYSRRKCSPSEWWTFIVSACILLGWQFSGRSSHNQWHSYTETVSTVSTACSLVSTEIKISRTRRLRVMLLFVFAVTANRREGERKREKKNILYMHTWPMAIVSFQFIGFVCICSKMCALACCLFLFCFVLYSSVIWLHWTSADGSRMDNSDYTLNVIEQKRN